MTNSSGKNKNAGLSKTTRVIMEAQLKEQQMKSNAWQQVLWFIYVIFIVLLMCISVLRTMSLIKRSPWRKDLDGQFPEACGKWAINGCTRVVLPAQECTRPEDITFQNTIIIDTTLDLQLNKEIADCVGAIGGAKLKSPDNLSTMNTNSQLIHISVTSTFFGFLDDMYMWTEPITVNGKEQRYIQMQSQLRMGSYDFDQNYYHVKYMIDCINKDYDSHSSSEMPCSTE